MNTPGSARFGPRELGLLVGLASMWGLSFLFIEVALRAVEPLWVVVLRTSVGALVLIAIVRIRHVELPRDPAIWAHLVVLGIINNGIPWTALAYAQQTLPSGQTALLMAFVPTSALLISLATGLEQLNRMRFVGVVTALGGVAVMVADELDNPARLTATGMVIGATVLYAIGSVYAKRTVSGRLPALSLACGMVASTAMLWLPIGFAFSSPPGADAMHWQIVGSLTALGGLGTGIAFLVYYILIERVGPTNTTMVTYLIPVIAVIAGMLLLGERLSALVLVGALLIGAGIWLSQRGMPRLPTDAVTRLPR